MTQLCQVVGCGPAALGVAVAADRMGVLPRLLGSGITFLDKAPDLVRLKRSMFPYVIESNSLAEEFAEAIAPRGQFGRRLAGSVLADLRDRAGHTVPLPLVGRLMAELADTLAELTDGSPSGIGCGRTVASVRRNSDGTCTTLTDDGHEIATSHRVVLATGATEHDADVRRRFGLSADQVMLSGDVLRGDLAVLRQVIGAGDPVTVVGGSHSGFAVAALLLDQFGDQLANGQVRIVHRGVTLWFRDLAEAAALGMTTGPFSACPATGMVNRYAGIRGGPRDVCIGVLEGSEKRVRLVPACGSEEAGAVADSAVVVQATGYRPVPVELRDGPADTIRLPSTRNGLQVDAVDRRGRVLDATGKPVENVFGLGIGYPRASAGGERKTAINVMHGPDAEQIVTELLGMW